ncbi:MULTISPECIES: DUF4083 family protein [Bacillaceae]|uniref:DUF4083 family protein n=1 Tax=Bacillaceae TaxID=186817 RepID=UPI0022862F37|nr:MULTISPECIES: DUF4083 family protein [Bacillaceae]
MLEIIYLTIMIVLILLFIISFTLFVRRMVTNSKAEKISALRIEEKLDEIIKLLKKQSN